MTADQYVLWFIVTAVLITAVLALGILEAAGLLPHPWRHDRTRTDATEPAKPRAEEHHHHWYDRFHHAA